MSSVIKIALSVALVSSLSFANQQFAMSDADRAMYAEMLENNPADMMIANGEELLGEYCGGDAGVAKFLNVSEDDLPKYLAGFPRYLEEFKQVVGIDQMLQGLMSKNGHKPFELKSSNMFDMSSYVKSLANGEKSNIDINANKHMKEAYALGEKTFIQKRGGRGLSCMSCHSDAVIGSILRTQPLPDLSAKGNAPAATWPAYRMTKSSLRTLQRRFQGCMNNALLKVIPLGSPEMVGLEVYLTHQAKGSEIAIPGLKGRLNMEVSRRDFMHIAAIFGLGAAVGGCASPKAPAAVSLKDIYDFKSMGNFTLLHMCDLHAHIKPLYWREPSTLISAPNLVGTPGFLCGESFAKHYGLEPSSLDAYFDTHIDFEELAKKFGKMGGIAHMKTYLDHVRKERGKENVLFLDSGDTWQGTGVALKTEGEAIVKAQNYLGVDVMVGHWEFTYGKERVKELIEMLDAKFVSQNIIGNDPFADEYEELIFEPYTIEERGGAKIGIIGQSFPFTSTANPKEFTEGWSFGIRHETLQEYVNELRNEHKVDCVVVLSHDGFSVDQELARMVNGIDFILSGHTHDPSPKPITVNGTVIVIAGSHGKYVGRLDIDAKDGKVIDYEYKLVPIASNMIPADPEGVKLVEELYAPFAKEFNEVLGKTKNILYKRDTFFSTFDQLINDAIMDEMKCDISFTPGYRWGTTVLAGDDILMDNVYEMCGITYPNVYTFELKGQRIATLLEDIADNVFNANPLYQQGGDMSRLGGVTYSIEVSAKAGKRISNLMVGGKPIDLEKTYVVSSWGGNLQNAGENLQKDKIRPVYDVTRDYIKRQKVVDVSNEGNVTLVDYECGCPTKGSTSCS